RRGRRGRRGRRWSHRRSVRQLPRAQSSFVPVLEGTEDVLDPSTRGDGGVGRERQQRRSLEPYLASDRRLQLRSAAVQRLGGGGGERAQPDGGVPEVRVSAHAGDREQREGGVVVADPLEGVGEDLTKHLVDPG